MKRIKYFTKKEKAIEKIKKNQCLYYIGKCVKNIRNKEFVDKVLSLDTTPQMVLFHHNGDSYPGKIIYYYKIGAPRGGFFGTFRMVLGALNYADQFGMLPVIEWDRSMEYYDESMDSITLNPFEYYFQQPVGISLAELDHVSNLVIGKPRDCSFIRYNFGYGKSGNAGGYLWDCKRFEELAVIMSKYIRINGDVQKQLESDLKKINITDRTVGVQVRRLVFQYEVKDHPIAIELDDYIAAIDKLLQAGEYDKIFLATEEEDTLTEIVNRFGEKVIYYNDVCRNNVGDTFLSVTSTRQRHHFLMGYEVLRDVYTLASCKSLVAGMSNVSMCAKIMKLSNKCDYSQELILNNGIVHNGISVKQAAKKTYRKMKKAH